MRRIYFCLAVAGLVLGGCSWQKQPGPATTLFRDFSLGSVVERMNVPELKPMSGGGGYSESLGEPVRRRRDFNLVFQIEEREGAKFDEAKFIGRLKGEIENMMGEAGVRENGGGSTNDRFHFDYSGEEHEGSLEVIGARADGNQYKLWGVIRENTRNKKD